MYNKTQVNNFVKIMKQLAKKSNMQDSRRMFTQYDYENHVVYISDGCAIFPIPDDIYFENCDNCKCPNRDSVENSKVNLREFFKTMNDDTKQSCIKTTLLHDIGGKLTNIYKLGSDFGEVDKRYVDMVALLPNWLSDFNPYAVNTKSPLVFYSDIINMGYVILPIYSRIEEIFNNLGFKKEN